MKSSKFARAGISALIAAAAAFSSPGTAFLPSAGVQAEAAAKLAAPSGVKTTAGNNDVTLTWSAVSGADAYRVYQYDAESGKYKIVKNVSKPKTTIDGLKKNTTYKFRIVTLLKGGSKLYEHGSTDDIEVKTSNVKLPSAPSNNYTGFASSGGKKYYFENGTAVSGTTKEIDGKLYLFGSDGALTGKGVQTVGGSDYYTDKNGAVKVSQWITGTMTDTSSVYYYANSKGKLTKYELNSGGRTSATLYINGATVKPKDLPTYGKTSLRGAYFRIGGDYYRLYLLATGVYAATGENALFKNTPVFDIRTGKQVANFCGYPDITEKFSTAEGSKVFNSSDGTIWTFNGEGKAPTASKAGDLVVVRKSLYTNYSKKTDFTVEYYNNTGKSIRSIIFTVYGIDSKGNKVRYEAGTEYNMYLQDTTGLTDRKGASKEWWSIFDSSLGVTDIVIAGAEITFTDSTKLKLSANRISQIY